MGVDEGGLQVIDIEVIILLYGGTYSPYYALMVFVIHTIFYDSMSKGHSKRGR